MGPAKIANTVGNVWLVLWTIVTFYTGVAAACVWLSPTFAHVPKGDVFLPLVAFWAGTLFTALSFAIVYFGVSFLRRSAN